MMNLWIETLLDWIYPRQCLMCGRLLTVEERHICLPCLMDLPRTTFHLHPENLMEERFRGIFPLERTAAGIINSAFGCAGERCMALSALCVEEEIADALIEELKKQLAAAEERLSRFGEKDRQFTLIRDNYCNAPEAVRALGYEGADGILLDLGVSSYQLDNAERGFSYRYDAPLDMRMDTRQTLTAKEIVNEYTEAELYRVIRDYGEDQFAKNIAKHIVQARKKGPVETTGQLNGLIAAAIPAKIQKKGGHPSKRTFQALRIECNRELEVLRDSVDGLIDLLNPGGRLCIITFHSLEDRIVKTAFRRNEDPCTCPPDFPVCVCGKKPKGRVITRKPILPSEEETEENPRSKSAKLRIFEKQGE